MAAAGGERWASRVIIEMPPRHGKSEFVSGYFPAWYTGLHPDRKVALASYESGLASTWGQRNRDLLEAYGPGLFGVQVRQDSQAKNDWKLTKKRGGMFTTGVGGALTGRGANVAIIDDPVKNSAEALSETFRERNKEWYKSTLRTRIEKDQVLAHDGAIVVIQTRWHEDDLSGGILPEGWDGESGRLKCRDGQDWEVLCLPAICDREDDPLGRKIGEPLWPEWFKDDHFEKFRGRPRTWSALFQQKPRPSEGAEFQKSWIRRYLTAPKVLNKIILVDPASGKRKKDGTVDEKRDYSCFWVVGLGADRNAYIVDCVRDRLNLTQRVATLMELHRRHRPIQVRYEEYGLQADIEAAEMAQEREQYRFKITPVGGSTKKEDRIRRLVPWFEEGNLYVPHTLPYVDTTGQQHDLIKEFIDQEYAAFPVARTDDMFDSLARLAEPDLKLPYPKQMANPGHVTEFVPLDSEIGY